MNNHSPCPMFVLDTAHGSDLGMRRLTNQDSLAMMLADDLATWVTRGHLFMVADGMGAHAAGELASQLATDNVPHTYHKLRDLHPPAAIRQAIRDANTVIHNKGQSSIGFQGMGTTCSCLVLLPQGALVAHIGDSRVYRLRGHQIEQLTFDHSLVWEMAEAGHMQQEDVPAYIPKNVITRSLGPHLTVNIDVEGPYDIAVGDVFLLCTDGLSGQVPDEELGAILQCLSPQEAVETLVDLANLRGGPDNISVIVARVVSNGALPESSAGLPPPTTASRPGWLTALLWIATGICLGALVFCAFKQFWTGVAASSVALVLAFIAAVVGRSNGGTACPAVRPIGGPYGNGPYRKTHCEPSRKVVDALAFVADEVRKLPERQPGDWKIEWRPFDEMRARAAATADAGNHVEAVRQYSQALREVMQQLREHGPPPDTRSFDGPIS